MPWSRSPAPAPGSRCWSPPMAHRQPRDSLRGAGRVLPPGHRCPARRPAPACSAATTAPTAARSVGPTARTSAEAGGPGGDQREPSRDRTWSIGCRAAGFGADTYRPSTRMAKRIRARDRRCRFPGCSIAAVFCDLDHVRPWPHGHTLDDNLLCLCRRHHRIKQRPGWQVTLAADAVATWTDPTGRTRTTHPVDALRTTILTGNGTHRHRHRRRHRHRHRRYRRRPARRRPPRRPAAPAGPAPSSPTAHTAHSSSSSNTTAPPHPATHRHEHQSRCGATTTASRHRTDLLPPVGTLVIDHHAWPGWRERHPRQCRDTDLPPF